MTGWQRGREHRSGTLGVGTTLVLTVAIAGLVGSCTAAGSAPPPPGPAPAVQLATSVAPGARDVAPDRPLTVSAAGGRLASVTVTPAGGAPLTGTLDPTGTRWTSATLAYDTEYRVRATGTGGTPGAPLDRTFRTVAPGRTVDVAAIRPTDGQTVGVAMPVSITFTAPVTDRAAVERRVSVRTSVPTEGSFHWMSDEQLNWRPKEFWRGGTTVDIEARLFGVDTGDGTFGAEDVRSGFTVGRDQRAVGDVNDHTLRLFADGAEVKSLPASFGRDVYPTQYGVHVAFEKYVEKRMTSTSWGGPPKGTDGFYDEVLPLAVRISNNGEFVHVNAASVSQQGRNNVSHGCVNLSPSNGRYFYDWIQMGDPVEIVGSDRPLTTRDGDIADWTIPWDDYRRGSALIQP